MKSSREVEVDGLASDGDDVNGLLFAFMLDTPFVLDNTSIVFCRYYVPYPSKVTDPITFAHYLF
jgi:hypothetical protein